MWYIFIVKLFVIKVNILTARHTYDTFKIYY